MPITGSKGDEEPCLSNLAVHDRLVAVRQPPLAKAQMVTEAQPLVGGAPIGYVWKPLVIGAGGYITGMDFNARGAVAYARTDTGGAYRVSLRGTVPWKQIVTVSSLPAASVRNNFYGGVLAIASAPTNARRVYMSWIDTIYRSDTGGDRWTATTLRLPGEDPNADPAKFEGERLAVDPVNPDVVYYGSLSKGLFVTTDAGLSWQAVAQLPSPGSNGTGVGNVRFDASYGAVNGRTLVAFVSIDGQGIFRTGDAGVSGQKITRAATNPANSNIPPDAAIFRHLETESLRYLYALADGAIYRYAAGVWRKLNAPVCFQGQCDADAIAIDPRKYGHFIVFRSNGDSLESTDSGVTFGPLKLHRSVGGDIPWLTFTDNGFFTHSNAYFDPIIPNKLWIGNGVGVWTSTDFAGPVTTWTSRSAGIEQLVNTVVVAPPGGKVVTGHWDRAIFYHDNLDAFPARHSPTFRFNSAWDITYAARVPNFMVASVHDHRGCCSQYVGPDDQSGYSTDGGQNWTVFPGVLDGTAPADLKFGDMAVASLDTNNIIWLPYANKPPYFTQDRGATWTPVTFKRPDGSLAFQGSYPDFQLSRHVVAADTVDDHTFCIYSSPEQVVFKTIDGGARWQQVGTRANGLNHSQLTLGTTMKAVPGHAGHLCIAGGFRDDFIPPLACSTDGGANWATVTATSEVTSFGYGKPNTAGGYPTIFIQGVVRGRPGVWCSSSQGVRWGKLATYPLGIPSGAYAMDGDKEVFGKVYMGFGGNGFVYGQVSGVAAATLCGG